MFRDVLTDKILAWTSDFLGVALDSGRVTGVVAFLPAARCSRNATWNWKHSKTFCSVLVARNASPHVQFSAQWAEGGAELSREGRPPLPLMAPMEGAVPDPGAVPFPGIWAALGPLSCPWEQVLPCTEKASSGGRLHTCFSRTLCYLTTGLVLVVFFSPPLPWISASLLKYTW